ncbi:hypothetical protein GCM10011414_11820 [Croceivirga lutea]|uniref:carboxypeptidase-like regulatory domain-containing protein n=1 Tax=Croceivirga lutea TaxID=1775167 RepID=UPI00163A16B6|nr:carboxypeptidase-like regulatory domain-containing protein [Croceivirga lutea]GGG43815.1 hypothetical protein GCM10011414_11820 [Croceivirga lutea]
MKNVLLLFTLCFSSFLIGQQTESKIISGTITDGRAPVDNVTIRISDKAANAVSDSNGKYRIEAQTGDVITYSYQGLKTVRIRVEDVTRILNITMVPDIQELEEVTVEASKRRSQKDLKADYVINKNIIRTAWGFLDAERASGNIRILNEEEINPISLCILDLLRNRFPGVQVTGSCLTGATTPGIGAVGNLPLQIGGQVRIRPGNSLTSALPAVFDIDGQIFTDTPIWLDVNRIKRIAILNNLATTASYGNLGAGGVVVINTINGSPNNNDFVDRARLKNNYADGKELSRAEVATNAPTYLKEFMASSSFEDSKAIFEKYHKIYSNSPYFLLDAYTHFAEAHNELDYADTIIEDNFQPYTNNPVLMKALAYTYESQQRFEMANEAYKEVFILRPNYVQSYMDMANSYRNIREPKQAASMYARYEYLIDEGFLELDTIDFGPIISREFNNLLMLERDAVVDKRKAKKLFIAQEEFNGNRLVFEWNDGEAEFDLQFVNPENQYYKWKHNMFDSPDAIEREKDFGYNVKEYLVDGSLPGTWQVNINYQGNKSLTPTYLKATIYYDYGSRTQRKEVKVFKLTLKNVNQVLFKLKSSSRVAMQ